MKKNNVMPFSRIFYGALILLCIFMGPSVAFAELKSLSEKEMRHETAQAGLASFSQSVNTIRMFMDIHLETWTEIDSAKIGYYARDANMGWDQSWQNVKIGTSVTDPMKMDGFVFKADFNDLQTASKPTLKRLVIGTNRLIGTMQANMESFTGAYNPNLTVANTTDDGRPLSRTNLGDTAFKFASPETETDKSQNQGFYIVITPEGNGIINPGIQIVAGYNEVNINSYFTPGAWWDK